LTDLGESGESHNLGTSTGNSVILALNKSDLPQNQNAERLIDALKICIEKYSGGNRAICLPVSCVDSKGIPELEKLIIESISSVLSDPNGSMASSENVIITRDRHRRHLDQCVNHLDLFLSNVLPMDAAAEELRYYLRSITLYFRL